MPDDDWVATTLAGIREDIEATADVYDLDGAGKNSYPVSAAMSRHALVLLTALEAVQALANEWEAKAKKIGGQITLKDCDGAVAGFKMIGYQNHVAHAKALREAITAELTKGAGE